MRLSGKGGNAQFDVRQVQAMCRSAGRAGGANGNGNGNGRHLTRYDAAFLPSASGRSLDVTRTAVRRDLVAAEAENEFTVHDMAVHEGETCENRSHGTTSSVSMPQP